MEVSGLDLIIELIFDNMFLVIILVFGLISSLGKKKSTDADETTRHPSQPRHTPVEMEKERQEQHRKKMTGQSMRDILEQMERQMSAALEDPEEKKVKDVHLETQRQEQLKRELERQEQLQQTSRPEREQRPRETTKPKVTTNSPIYANDLTKSTSLSFTKESVAQGIIYSEILSKPRALNPYQRGVKK